MRKLRPLAGLAVSVSLNGMLMTAGLGATATVADGRGRFSTGSIAEQWGRVVGRSLLRIRKRVAFGADLLSGDGKAAASYSIFGAGSLNQVPGYENPDRAVASSLSRFGQEQVRFGRRMQIDNNVFAISYQTRQTDGMAFWQVIPTQAGGAMVVMRTAYSASGTWSARGAEASAVARSLRCNVPNVPCSA